MSMKDSANTSWGFDVRKISSEADKLLKAFFEYTRRRRDAGIYDFTQIVHEYSKYVLPEFLSSQRNSLAKRFNSMIREHVATDPRYQSRLDVFYRNVE